MEWVGFLTLLLIGLGLCISGVALCVLSAGFSGRIGSGMIIPIIGGGIIFLAFKFAPFSIVIN